MKDKDFEDFESEFLSTDETSMKSDLLESKMSTLREAVSSKLNPSWGRLLKKLAIVHVVTSLITLSLCNQMGVRLFFDGPGMMDLFMVFGFWACMGLCGAFYIGASFLDLAFVVDLDERNKFQKQIPLVVSLVAVASLGGLLAGGASVSLGVALVWLLGAELAGIMGFKLASRWRFRTNML